MRPRIASAVVLISGTVALVKYVQPSFRVTLNHAPNRTAEYRPMARRYYSCALAQVRESHRIIKNTSSIFRPYQTYQSSPFDPLELQIFRNGQPLAPGLLFVSPEDFGGMKAPKDIAPLIMNDAGQLVWNGPNIKAINFRVAISCKATAVSNPNGMPPAADQA